MRSLAFSRPGVVGIPIEQGLGVLTADLFPQPRSFEEIMEMLRELASGEHDYTGVVIDAVDGAQELIAKAVCDEHGKRSLADFGFGFAPSGSGGASAETIPLVTQIRVVLVAESFQLVHFYFDSFIWRLSDPRVREGL